MCLKFYNEIKFWTELTRLLSDLGVRNRQHKVKPRLLLCVCVCVVVVYKSPAPSEDQIRDETQRQTAGAS